jgi:AraC-like DNA-binding protein
MTWDEGREERNRRMIFVGNVHSNVTTGDLRRHIESAYRLTIAADDIVMARGYAFVTLASGADAARVIATGLPPLAGREIVVARRRPLRRSLRSIFLREQGWSVTEVAFSLGFADVSSFSRAFRRWTGVSPSQYAAGAEFVADDVRRERFDLRTSCRGG